MQNNGPYNPFPCFHSPEATTCNPLIWLNWLYVILIYFSIGIINLFLSMEDKNLVICQHHSPLKHKQRVHLQNYFSLWNISGSTQPLNSFVTLLVRSTFNACIIMIMWILFLGILCTRWILRFCGGWAITFCLHWR